MKIIISGGSGFIGSALVNQLIAGKHTVVLFTRNPGEIALTRQHLTVIQWDGKTIGAWAQHLDGADAVVNLAGESLANKQWTREQKARLLDSRIDSTRVIVEGIAQASQKPAVLINASAVGYYGHVESGDVTEDSPNGHDFLASLTMEWEKEASRASRHGVRVVTPRFGVVLDRNGGALPRLVLPFKLFAGGWLGSGKQWFPWIHREDLVRAIIFAMTNNTVTDALNLAAPDAVTNKQFCKVLGTVLHRPCWALVPAIVLRIALGEMADMLLTGQKVIPTRLLKMGFRFRYPTLRESLQKIFSDR
ncbi:MAG: TIGR01777 family protein [Ignavibacteriae bacterium]|nr:TIGR01777 family protein [Ignavibacteria bacterium]MBI3364033.1 TIGR01777 family protein [Ignavibacteriota bacterium]